MNFLRDKSLSFPWLLAGCLLAAMPSPARARVFLRWRAAARAQHAMESLGGKSVYEADITLNGGNGKLRVYAFDRPLRAVGRDLEQAFGIDGIAGGHGSMALATAHLDGIVLRLVAVDLTGGRQTMVFTVQQTEREFALSKEPPEDGAVGGIPAYPGSRPLFKAEDHNTGTALAVSRSGSPAAVVREFYRSRLPADGWEEAIPNKNENTPHGDHPTAGPSLSVYMKPAAVCCVLAEENGFPNTSRITIVHKTQRID